MEVKSLQYSSHKHYSSNTASEKAHLPDLEHCRAFTEQRWLIPRSDCCDLTQGRLFLLDLVAHVGYWVHL